MTELLVNVSMRFPADIEPTDLSFLIGPVVRSAVSAGGLTTNLSVQPFELEELDNASPVAVSVPTRTAVVHTGEEQASADATPSLAAVTIRPCASGEDAQGDRDDVMRCPTDGRVCVYGWCSGPCKLAF